jgi:hypothetical protein
MRSLKKRQAQASSLVYRSTVSVFTIDAATGSLSVAGSPVPRPTTTLATPGMAVTPDPGNFLYIALTAPLTVTASAKAVYVMNTFDNPISASTWDSGTGKLTPINGSPFNAQGGSGERVFAERAVSLCSVQHQFVASTHSFIGITISGRCTAERR